MVVSTLVKSIFLKLFFSEGQRKGYDGVGGNEMGWEEIFGNSYNLWMA